MRVSAHSLFAAGAMALAALCATATPGRATTYRHYEDRELIVSADLVIEGTILAIAGPPQALEKKRRGCSVAQVRVERIFKGDIKLGADVEQKGRDLLLRFAYWSHEEESEY